ncbi:serine hydrolase domain-containing protein [Novosphingobium sp. ST904]|uniref:serine hydrolase domain-containing protein n=1 Tax=Novosphingobium sp. ST904 TaxID=1684385 RepID=UPI0006C83191|nr:serine hydrolase domain-containing protein [Novosphingobium sp. ST904]KPH66846.1 beta-lactamase [Novosphingobium sp. ST904]TCM25489.1 CubicO group peptidase (beta-lactamase class C family) [Novosphingobium sp. ST904]
MAKHQAANAAVQQVLDALVEEGTEIGVQVAAYLNGELVVDAWAGVADPATGRKVDSGTLFNVFSVTKAVAATALHVQAERGLVDYDSPVARYWPEYGSNGKEAVTVRDALSHRTGTPQMPPAVTPEMMCDWDAMTAGIAALEPIFPVGQPAYQAVSFGWVIGEIVRRTDPERRSFRDFVAQEIAGPFDIEDLWIGVPEAAEPRIARLVDALNMQPPPAGTVLEKAMPFEVRLAPDIFEREDVRRATIAGVGGIFTARSLARFWSILANGGELDGKRLLSRERVAMSCQRRPGGTLPDPVFFGMPMPLSQGGYWMYDGQSPLTMALGAATAIACPGAGGSLGWADPATGLAVAFCHNRMSAADGASAVGNAIRTALGLV